MILLNIKTFLSPRTPGYTRLDGDIILDSNERINIWVDVPQEYSNDLSGSGNPWLIAMLPIAVATGEKIRIEVPVDPWLLENVRGVARVWASWYRDLYPVVIECDSFTTLVEGAAKTGVFFSGGIDSYFTIARRLPGNSYGFPVLDQIDDLLTVQGFDLSVHDNENFIPLAKGASEIAQSLRINHIVVHTNLRDNHTHWMRQWGPLTHGAGLAFVGLALERRYRKIVFGSGVPLTNVRPWGSHPMIDPLFSTSSVTIVHDGASFTRVEKTRIIGGFPLAMSFLHVCQATGTNNCSLCEKCYRTMVTLDLLGLKNAATNLFDWSEYGVPKCKKLYVKKNDVMLNEILSAAQEIGRTDISNALRFAKRRSVLIRKAVALSEKLERLPFFWKIGSTLKKIALKGSITQRNVPFR